MYPVLWGRWSIDQIASRDHSMSRANVRLVWRASLKRHNTRDGHNTIAAAVAAARVGSSGSLHDNTRRCSRDCARGCQRTSRVVGRWRRALFHVSFGRRRCGCGRRFDFLLGNRRWFVGRVAQWRQIDRRDVRLDDCCCCCSLLAWFHFAGHSVCTCSWCRRRRRFGCIYFCCFIELIIDENMNKIINNPVFKFFIPLFSSLWFIFQRQFAGKTKHTLFLFNKMI